ncbi:hypothetical protein AVEN_209980-1 [Araneus ventricosus]|uniref:Uncharacterized protein n=1 Tax=Araneus ventricosus TaxID=182803 RepID=A0A4Y2DDJ3_ARAVE|nr:hypothetical protein AVEN_209980-1 [Araneus ventricosus]
MVSASASEPIDRKFYPGLCPYSVFAIVCTAILLQVRPMVTSKPALTCCKLVSTCTLVVSNLLQACRFAVQVYCKLKLLSEISLLMALFLLVVALGAFFLLRGCPTF